MDLTSSGSPSWLDKIKQTVQNIIQAFSFFKSPVDLSGILYLSSTTLKESMRLCNSDFDICSGFSCKKGIR